MSQIIRYYGIWISAGISKKPVVSITWCLKLAEIGSYWFKCDIMNGDSLSWLKIDFIQIIISYKPDQHDPQLPDGVNWRIAVDSGSYSESVFPTAFRRSNYRRPSTAIRQCSKTKRFWANTLLTFLNLSHHMLVLTGFHFKIFKKKFKKYINTNFGNFN
jgi:hypothetical protein